MANANEVSRLVSAVTNVAYNVSDVLNAGLNDGSLDDRQAEVLRMALAHLGNANSELWCLYQNLGGREAAE